jgi:hypothetical protein
MGMLGKNLHLKNSCFRTVPNPTPYHWDKKFFSIRKLIREYKKKLMDDDLTIQTVAVQRLCRLSEKVVAELRASANSDNSIPLLNVLHSAVDECEMFLKEQVSRDLVAMVVREHFQEVLRMINNEDDVAGGPVGLDTSDDSDGISRPRSRHGAPGMVHVVPRFDDLNIASPEDRQEKFMDIYFAVVLPRVMRQAVEAFRRRTSTGYVSTIDRRDTSSPTMLRSSTRIDDELAMSPPMPPSTPEPTSPPTDGRPNVHYSEKDLMAAEANGGARGFNLRRTDTETLDTAASNIWCTLVFRMLCWLMLHDFHKRDVQISKSECLGSRLPVYLA